MENIEVCGESIQSFILMQPCVSAGRFTDHTQHNNVSNTSLSDPTKIVDLEIHVIHQICYLIAHQLITLPLVELQLLSQ